MPRGFTIVDLAGAVAGSVVMALLAYAAIQPDSDAAAKRKSQQAADVKNLRGIGQAMVIWAQSHNDSYPLPSEVDKLDATIPGGGTTKNTTANIFSLMIGQGLFGVEVAVSPLEMNPDIVKCEGYEFKSPKKAAVPERGLWDPAFSADFTDGKKGNVSYCHLQPAGKRLEMWSNTFVSTEMAAGTRGPEIEGIDKPGSGKVAPRFANPPEGGKGTQTCGFYGEGKTWTGNFVYNDNSVRPLKPGLTHGEAIGEIKNMMDFPTYELDGQKRPDIPFFDEPDDMSEKNMYLGIFTEAGADKKQFKSIWD